MKKTLPLIIILISLSLIGLIALQVNWINNLVEIREVEMQQKTMSAATNVANDLSSSLYENGFLKFKKRLQDFRLDNSRLDFFKTPTIDTKFTKDEIELKLHHAFQKEGLKNIIFEFAVVNEDKSEYELLSNSFIHEVADSIHNKIYPTAVLPQSGTDFESLTPHEVLVVVVPKFTKQIWNSIVPMLIASFIFTTIIIAAFYITLRTLMHQKKLSEIKSDFINNMTHEFKTPLATISLAVDAIRNEKVQNDKEKLGYFSGIIKEENKRMNKHVETILQASLLEKKEFQYAQISLNAHEIIEAVAQTYDLQLQEKQGNLQLFLNAKQFTVLGDELHFTNIISNLLDNAIKYSKEDVAAQVIVTTKNVKKQLVIQIEDNGIGMNKETVKRVFEKFYRAHTGNVHNVKGFGLGMSYVKTIVEAMKGDIKASSILGKGSTFTLSIPLEQV
jgi:two-component system, OmpR family, phosphate regulon sensor histidine kinase PhoR